MASDTPVQNAGTVGATSADDAAAAKASKAAQGISDRIAAGGWSGAAAQQAVSMAAKHYGTSPNDIMAIAKADPKLAQAILSAQFKTTEAIMKSWSESIHHNAVQDKKAAARADKQNQLVTRSDMDRLHKLSALSHIELTRHHPAAKSSSTTTPTPAIMPGAQTAQMRHVMGIGASTGSSAANTLSKPRPNLGVSTRRAV